MTTGRKAARLSERALCMIDHRHNVLTSESRMLEEWYMISSTIQMFEMRSEYAEMCVSTSFLAASRQRSRGASYLSKEIKRGFGSMSHVVLCTFMIIYNIKYTMC